MDKLRLRFEKTGRAVYISHLDLMTTMQRGFARAGYALRYSEGFNPHPLISILLPLSVGMASRCELMDFRLVVTSSASVRSLAGSGAQSLRCSSSSTKTHSADAALHGSCVAHPLGSLSSLTDLDLAELPARLTAALPEGITALEVYPAERKSAALKWLEVEGVWEYDRGCPAPGSLEEFFCRDSLVIEKKTKRGIGQTDIRPAIRAIAFAAADDGMRVHATVSAQEPTLNPELLAGALRQLKPELAPDFARFTRLETLDADGGIYR